ncbi:MAG: hypothetical protein H7842_01370 [Gammaproteobacteria bacterium SHHR-1]|uniref:hypothetical protein n=1 Tax=Magnetovirga frankeli TaxID=947516 RepID=UPI0012937A0D|nr:hypothetical protein D5125_13970 [gamma proteobacterium SS-5]
MGDLSLSGISFPAQTPLAPDSFLNTPRRTQQWLKGLAKMPLARIAHQGYKALRTLNRSTLPLADRHQVSSLLALPLLHNSQRLEKYFLSLSFPLSEMDHKLAQLDRALLHEMALACKTLLRDQLHQGGRQADLLLSLQQTLQLQLAGLRQAALTYHGYPKNFWGETQPVFALARAAGLAQKSARNGLSSQPQRLHAENLYKQILLLGLSDHYRLRQQDILTILNHLPSWAEATELTETGPANGDCDGLFSLDLQRNRPPLHLSLLAANQAAQPQLLLDARPLLQRLRELRNQAQWNNLTGQYESQGLTGKTLDHLGLVWRTVPPRSDSRTDLHFELTMVVGLGQICSLLQSIQLEQPRPPMGVLADISQRSASPDNWVAEPEVGLAEEPRSQPYLGMDLGQIDEQIYLAQDSSFHACGWQEERKASLQNYSLVNQSSRGYCIRWNTQNAPAIKLGELLGIRDDDNPQRFGLGISRWMKYENEYSLLGIALIARDCQPIQARLAHNDNSPIHPCLLLDPAEGEDTPRLAAPPLAFRAGQEVSLFDSLSQTQIRLLDLIEGSAAFNLFSYEESGLTYGDGHDLTQPLADQRTDP